MNLEPLEKEINNLAYQNRINKNLKSHTWEHTLRVVEYSKMIAKSLEDNIIENVLIASYFHDIGRKDDKRDISHGKRSAKIIKEKADDYFPLADIDSIVFAIKYHSDTATSKGQLPVVKNYRIPKNVNPKIAMCLWDADRLDLMRLSNYKKIRKDYLNTDLAKKFANSKEHKKRYYFLKT